MLLSAVFIKFIPHMLNAGNKIGTIKNAFSDVVRSKFGREQKVSLFTLDPIIASTISTTLNETKRGIVANGVL